MKIASISSKPVLEIPFLNAGKGPGSFYVDRLPVLVAKTDSLPPDLDAIIATADLQGRERFEETKGGPPRLLGEVLPQRLSDEILPGLCLFPSVLFRYTGDNLSSHETRRIVDSMSPKLGSLF